MQLGYAWSGKGSTMDIIMKMIEIRVKVRVRVGGVNYARIMR